MREDANRWLKQADHDLEMARKNLQIQCYDICLILCQQAIEKYLKALYIFQKNAFPPRTHSFKFLVEQLNLPQEFLAQIIDIDKYYASLRYPDVSDKMPYENCSKEDAEMGITKAEMVQITIKGKIK